METLGSYTEELKWCFCNRLKPKRMFLHFNPFFLNQKQHLRNYLRILSLLFTACSFLLFSTVGVTCVGYLNLFFFVSCVNLFFGGIRNDCLKPVIMSFFFFFFNFFMM